MNMSIANIVLAIAIFLPVKGTSGERASLTVDLNAPYDGYLVLVPNVGDTFPGHSSLPQWISIASDPNCIKAKIDNSAFSGARISSFNNTNAIPAAELFSPILEAQIAEARQNKEAYKNSLVRIDIAAAQQTATDHAQQNIEAARRDYEGIYVQTKRDAAWDTNDAVDGMSKEDATRLVNVYRDMAEKERIFLLEAQQKYKDFNLTNMREDAVLKLASANCSLAIHEMTKVLSKVYCPFDCEVTDVHVGAGQWVVMGDRIISVAEKK